MPAPISRNLEVGGMSAWLVSQEHRECGYWLGLTLGRFLISPIAARIGTTAFGLMYACLAAVIAATTLAWLSPSAVLAPGQRPVTAACRTRAAGRPWCPRCIGSSCTAGLEVRSAGGLDVLVDVEGVVRVVAALDLGEPVVVAAVGGFDALLALAHHEVDVAAACRGRVQRLPVVPRPLRDEAGVGGIGVNAHDDAGEAAAAVGEGGRF